MLCAKFLFFVMKLKTETINIHKKIGKVPEGLYAKLRSETVIPKVQTTTGPFIPEQVGVARVETQHEPATNKRKRKRRKINI